MSDYFIRLYKDSDYDVARDLFAHGTKEYTSKAFHHSIRLPHIWLPVLVVLTLPVLNLMSIPISILMAAIAVVTVWFGNRYIFTSYIDYVLSDDMLDIREYYLQRDGYSFWVAESSDGEVIGTIAALPSSEPGGEKHLEMRRLSVAEHHRGKGIGSVLCRTLIDFARRRGCKAVVLTTTLSQIEAQKMYEKLGFRHTQNSLHPGLLGKVLDFGILAYKYDIPSQE
ncbi:probable N-acetyltransferase camello [Dendropsophus ebraccatus]|uniref:probable N-acetyltransferase camello n=1 Tax=Dendropsophus ebraccatus TaxID=150705 RepID=UPI0038311002